MGSVAVIHDFRRETSEYGTFISLEYKGRNGGGILSEINDKGFTFFNLDRLSRCELLGNHNCTICIFRSTFNVLPSVGPYRL